MYPEEALKSQLNVKLNKFSGYCTSVPMISQSFLFNPFKIMNNSLVFAVNESVVLRVWFVVFLANVRDDRPERILGRYLPEVGFIVD